MRTRVALATTGLAITALIGVAVITPVGPAAAAAAKNVVLGKSNKTTTTTTIQNTKGTALSLKAPAKKAPLAVSNSVTVKNLSADKLDGLTSNDFARTKGITGTIVVEDGIALCPSGTVVTGGGGVPEVDGDSLAYSAVATDDTGKSLNGWDAYPLNPDNSILVLATCYSPSGKAVEGSLEANAATNSLTAAQQHVLARRQAAKAHNLVAQH